MKTAEANMNQKEIFLGIYNSLNERQKQAVDSLEGPVMVIAGPGTGKTQILGARIGKILLETDARPENILCLTYTEAGVVAMRRRLLGFIGPDAYKVNIYTFHAFCNDIIQENLFLFEKKSLDPISELERIDYFKKLIGAFPRNHLLKRYRGDAFYEMNPLQALFSTMKREGWTPAFIHGKIDEYVASLPDRPIYVAKRASGIFKKGDVRTDKIAEEKEKMEKLRAAVNEFEPFQQLMRDHNRYDFDDMISWVIKKFEEDENLLRRYQEQFLYILVDEYQDTSGSQNHLVQLLINYWDKPNIFVVGDDDQSIFRFQGASVENMSSLHDKYGHDLLKVVLTENYRSVQPVLDISKTLIDRNRVRLVNTMTGLSKHLLASKEKLKGLGYMPEIREYETQRQEMVGITLEVEKLLQQGVAPAEIGIIYKENKWGLELAQYCKLRNIPVFSKRSMNVLEIPLAQKVVSFCSYLATEHEIPYSGDELLFEILHYDWFQVPPIEIAKITVEVAERQYTDTKISLRRLLHEKATEPPRDLFSRAIHPRLQEAQNIIEQLIADVPNITLQMLIENMIRRTGLLQQIMQSPDKISQLQVLTTLFDFVKDETHRNPSLSLKKLVNIVETMDQEGIPLPLVEVSGSEKGVNLLTAHGSKGLEFDYVFFSGCNSTYWEKKRKPSGGYKLPDNLFTSGPEDGSHDEDEELRRLFYVAITRAAQHLYLSYSRFRNDGKELEPSMFIAEIQEVHELPTVKQFIDPATLAEFQLLQFQGEQAPEIEKMEEEFVSRLLMKFVMNVTALNNYLKCPLEFYFKNLLRIPSPKNEATEFGSAVHYALEQLFRGMQANNDRFPAVHEFLSWFDAYMQRHRESFTAEQFARRMEYGHTVLPAYYDKYAGSWNKIVAIERNIRNVVVQGVPLKGKLDKLEFDGKAVNVVDYKTGDPDKARSKLVPSGDKDPNGGDYWRQAVFYKILIDHHDQRGWQAVSTEFDFIEPDNKKNYRKIKLVISPQDISTVTQQITDTWEK
ncbi:MAG TPA: ATP-dependent DNA helicase, partial [Puia sp.]|nr:ATP-dependent DNA helicase [Puia sp.]